MRKKIILITVLLVAVLCLTGCTIKTVEQMYQLPKRSTEYRNLQSVIDQAMQDLEYCAPLAGENQQNVQMADLDGDGEDEYLIYAKGTSEKPLRILVFSNRNGTYTNIDTIECNGTSFDQVEYVDMDGISGKELVVGRQLSDQVIRSVSVYRYTDEGIVQLATMNYNKFLCVDLDGNNQTDLFLLGPGQTELDNGIAELYSIRNGAIERFNEVHMSQPVSMLKRIITGKLDGGKQAIFVASAVADTSLVTDVYTILDEKLVNVTLSNEVGTDIQTMRNYYVYADDIDNDGIVELPHLITMKPMTEGSTGADKHHLICWYAMTKEGTEVNKMYTYHNFVGGWYMQFSEALSFKLTVLNLDNRYEFYLWNKNYTATEKIMTVYALTGQGREEQATSDSRFILHKTESVLYAAQLESVAQRYDLTQEKVVYSFRLIQQDWKTGET